MYTKKTFLLFCTFVVLTLTGQHSWSATLKDFSFQEKAGSVFKLKNNGGKCADIPTNAGKIMSPARVIAWNCGSKDWQLWSKSGANSYRNVYHKECVFNNSGLSCNQSGSGIDAYPLAVKSGNFFQLKARGGKCADVPTNGGNGKIMAPARVLAWQCGDKNWQKWEKIGEGRYRNAFHNQCVLDNNRFSCQLGGSHSKVATNTDCIIPVGDHFELNKSKALKINGQACTRQGCNNPNVDYLKACTSFVHGDCFVTNNVRTIGGFHRGLSEGGSSNKHYWDSIDNLYLKGLKSGKNIVSVYDKQSCLGSPKIAEFEVYMPQ